MLKKAGAKKAENLKWTDELAEVLHKPVVKQFRKRNVYVKGIDEIWGAELVDLQVYSNSNDGVKYLLTIVDIFKTWVDGTFETENWSCCSCCFSDHF